MKKLAAIGYNAKNSDGTYLKVHGARCTRCSKQKKGPSLDLINL